ncbi:hypothetical protein GLX30_30205 [Streptomyces sp. Tu 2975]|uniref:hypothetical protein n=1 Tax=Streptomyces sp. Tu 2975 TaxID=2676871 RepID=UPI00135743D8|nr:hypothetical protein [Streptomyces sp. Tu 2975]QIP87590.1 hypothetical protein GLX30_30205 [Streptomyces sp. Tu 2975]
MLIRLGRWTFDVFQRALHITREPDPNCADCNGSGGGWMPITLGADWDECGCLDQLRTWRLPLAPRRRATYTTEPF